ncbi:MAG: UvrD-helicase domain-containing protein [Ignavibacteria bacterium]|jgi:DNA helicase-2/ATP-dependent DNA helicase PcrA|nr:UvrD-helicase domain-containing protein [Ignavibacteria bacterium]
MLSLKSLNPEQKKAVEFDGAPSIIIAGAGSGKTRVLTYKIAYLIEQGYNPGEILALTFTNKAAKEMKERIKKLIGVKAQELWMGTFHSTFAKILRIEAKSINYDNNFSIYDAEDSLALVNSAMTGLNISSDTVNANSVRHRISYLKNHMIFPKEFKERMMASFLDEKIAEIYEEYQFRITENNAMDFEDLLLKPIELFENNPKILQKYKKKFSYLLVDEFQDTNKAQYELLKLLATKDGKICVVGDDAQSIYSWRGAEITNMLNFEKDFRKVKVFRLEQNYRSTKNILAAADSIIKNNRDQLEKTLWTSNEEGEPLSLLKCSDEKDEAYQIAKFIKEEIHENKLSMKDFAILYRTNAQSRALEDIFRREKIPYVIIGGIEFYKRKEVKDIVAYLRVITNQQDEESLLRIMNFPQRGIGSTTIGRMIGFARKHGITLFDTMSRVFEVIDIKERIQKNVKGFKILLDKYIGLRTKLSASELTRSLIDELGLIRMFREENNPESLNRLQNIEELLSAITDYSKEKPEAKLEDYLQEVALINDLDLAKDDTNLVTMMTIHAAKGLEFPVVFMSGCEEDIFPLSTKFSSDASVEEERRLFYVAMTRAQKKVYISHARSRYRFGEVAYQNRSRFIDELDAKTLSEMNGNAGRKANRKSKKEIYYEYFENLDYEDFTQENRSLKIGSRVMHDKFGMGKVIQLIGAGENQKATVSFEGNNVKQLMLKFAKLKVLN